MKSQRTIWRLGAQCNVKSAKFLVYPAPANLRAARAAHFNVYASLETLYPREVWTDASAGERLSRRDPGKICRPDLINRIILGDTTMEAQLDPEWAYLVRDDFKIEYKIPTAEALFRQADQECRNTLANFEPWLREALAFLGIDPGDAPASL